MKRVILASLVVLAGLVLGNQVSNGQQLQTAEAPYQATSLIQAKPSNLGVGLNVQGGTYAN